MPIRQGAMPAPGIAVRQERTSWRCGLQIPAVASVALFDARGSTRRRSTHNGGTATFRGSSRCFVMGMIEFEESAIQVDATIVGEGLVHRFRSSNHIRQRGRAYRTKYGRRDGD